MSERVKFKTITRVICPRTGVHYLDAISDKGEHWEAQMSHGVEPWIVYTSNWRKDPQQPYQN